MQKCRNLDKKHKNDPLSSSDRRQSTDLLTQQEMAAKTLHYFSQQSSKIQNVHQHLSCTHYKHRYFQNNNSWNQDPQIRQSFESSPNKKEQTRFIKRPRRVFHSQLKDMTHQSPSNMLLQLTRSLNTMQTNRQYKVRVKARCSMNSFLPTTGQQKQKYLVKKSEKRINLQCSSHILPTPRQNTQREENKLVKKKPEGNAIKKLKRDIIKSLQSKIEIKEYLYNNIKLQFRASKKQGIQTTKRQASNSMYRTGWFRQSMVLKMKKKTRTETTGPSSYKNFLSEVIDVQGHQNPMSALLESSQFQRLENLLDREKNF